MDIRTIDELFEVTRNKLENEHGTITINFANRNHVYSGNDVIGNCLQEWLPNWFSYLGVNVLPGEFSQEFPDFVVSFDDVSHDVEVKAWNINNAPAFDLANFGSFIATTYDDPRKIDAKYFIMGYRPADDGFSEGFKVEKVYMKNLWEITAPSRKYPIGLQVKRGEAYAVRPYNFHRKPNKGFTSRKDFISAIKNTFDMYPNANIGFTSDQWLERMTQYYEI